MWKDFILGDGSKIVKQVDINGKIVFKRQSYVDAEFTACPFPTSWTTVTAYVKYSAENEYGIWNVEASSALSGNYPAKKAFNNVSDDYWCPTSIGDVETAETIEISLPTKVLIKPTNIYVKHLYQGNASNKSKIQGYNSETNLWEDLGELAFKKHNQENTFTISNDTFYSKFRVLCYGYSSSLNIPIIYELQVRSGTIRKYT